MAAGTVTTLAAANSIYNFCIGGFPAAILAVTTAGSAEKSSATVARFAVAGRTALAGVLLLASSLSHFYGENPVEAGPRQHITEGIFAGLAVRADQSALLETMRDRLLPLIGSGAHDCRLRPLSWVDPADARADADADPLFYAFHRIGCVQGDGAGLLPEASADADPRLPRRSAPPFDPHGAALRGDVSTPGDRRPALWCRGGLHAPARRRVSAPMLSVLRRLSTEKSDVLALPWIDAFRSGRLEARS